MSIQRVGDRKRRQMSERTGLEILRVWRVSNTQWFGVIPQGDGHSHVRIDPSTGEWSHARYAGCIGGDEDDMGCRPFGPPRFLVTLDPETVYPAEQRRADFEIVAGAVRELSNAWVRSEIPSDEVGRRLAADAVVALSRLAVAAHVPLETELHDDRARRARIAAGEIWTG